MFSLVKLKSEERMTELFPLTGEAFFQVSPAPAVVSASVTPLFLEAKKTIVVSANKSSIDFSPLFRAGQHDLPRKFALGQVGVKLRCTSRLFILRLHTSQFMQHPGEKRMRALTYMSRPASGREIAACVGGNTVMVYDICHTICQPVMVKYAQHGVILKVLDMHGSPLLVRVVRVEDVVGVIAYEVEEKATLPRSYVVQS